MGVLFASSSLFDEKPKDKQAKMLTAHDKATIMIMGVDEREDDVGRSDTLMIATVDPKKNQAALLSVPRDTRVKVKGHGYDKINAAYAYGGERLTQDTVENLLGVQMDHYVIINTKAFQRIIDAIGGVDINVEKRMYYEDPWDDDGGLVIDLYPGKQHMDGKTAITYVRYRDTEGDIGRIKRQQNFMKAVMDKVTSPSIITKLPAIIKEVAGSVKTDLSIRQLLEFAGTLKESQRNGLKTEMVPGKPMYISGISYWIPDISDLRMAVAGTLDVPVSSSLRAQMQQEEDEYMSTIPSGATEIPADDTSIGSMRDYQKDDSYAGESKRSKKQSSSEDKDSSSDDSPAGEERQPAVPPAESMPSPAPSIPAPTPVPGASGGGKTM